ncbi:MAG TPA: AmmeMemoRadiSam system radical SAM enzyme [bacterium]|nr:AmmeMemoRadiSam system radical SAM enzyme [bacterium]
MIEAKYYEKLDNNKVHCYLCPRHCKIGDGQPGFCFVRKNEGGTLYQMAYNQPYAINIDPIEKKPLFHFFPGTTILSIGTAGCNIGCKFCQNWDISKAQYDHGRAFDFTVSTAVDTARSNRCASMAYTYNEPTIWAEYVEDLSAEARARGLYNVMVTNGYISPEVIDEVYANIDAANVDLKAFSEEFYKKITLSELQPVLEALKLFKQKGVWLELTTLIIPTLNDDMAEIAQLCEWVLDALGPETPVHFTAFHPDYKLRDLPRTSLDTLEQARKVALDTGIRYVYVGNVHSDSANTYCPECGETLIRRNWHSVRLNTMDGSRCPNCGHDIPGVFPSTVEHHHGIN